MYEINLVPDIKLQMIKMQKIRNLVFFICIVVAAAAAGVVLILSMIVGGQNLAMSGQDRRLRDMSAKVLGYEGLNEFLTIQDQLSKLARISDGRKMLSRTFSILNVMLPQGADSVTLSELNINLDTNTLIFDGQADAGEDPLIDYRVLEAFKKGVALTKFDYGRYVDANGTAIPTRCIEESTEAGEIYNENGNIYAIWKRGEYGCDPQRDDNAAEENRYSVEDVMGVLDTSGVTDMSSGIASNNLTTDNSTTNSFATSNSEVEVVETTTEEGQRGDASVPDEIIYRTPLFNEWHENGGKSTSEGGYAPNMTLSGEISGVPHFDSSCFKYTGADAYNGNQTVVKWSAENTCILAPNGVDIRESSNGKDNSGNLVLRFNATIELAEELFFFKNKHVMAIGPAGQNVTDSYVQIEGMFDERAQDCAAEDDSCSANVQNMTGGN